MSLRDRFLAALRAILGPAPVKRIEIVIKGADEPSAVARTVVEHLRREPPKPN